MDVYEAVFEEDLKQATIVIASLVYQTAMREERIPRKPLPQPSETQSPDQITKK
jgi:hypothetical protein